MQLVVLHEIDFNLALSNSQFKTKRVSLFYWNVVSDNADYYLCSKYSVGKSRFTERETKTLTVFTGALDRSIDRSAIGRAANSYIWKISAPKTKSMSSCCLIERIYKQDFAWIIFFFKDSPNEYISPSIFFSIMAAKYETSLFAKFGDTCT